MLNYLLIIFYQYDTKVSPEDNFYNFGVELTADGLFGHHNYIKHATRGTLSLHSLYLLLWANFGAFCMALLTQPDSHTKIHAKLISEDLQIRSYCLSKVKELWNHIGNFLYLTSEERTLYATRAMINFYEVLFIKFLLCLTTFSFHVKFHII